MESLAIIQNGKQGYDILVNLYKATHKFIRLSVRPWNAKVGMTGMAKWFVKITPPWAIGLTLV